MEQEIARKPGNLLLLMSLIRLQNEALDFGQVLFLFHTIMTEI